MNSNFTVRNTYKGSTIDKYVGTDSEVIIPEGIECIGMNAFEGCIRIKTVIIPEGVKTISYLAFSGCTSLEKVYIPKSIQSIDHYIFSGVGK